LRFGLHEKQPHQQQHQCGPQPDGRCLAQQYHGHQYAAQVAYLVTPSGVLMSMVLLGEAPSVWLWAALVLLLVGLFLVQPKPETVVLPDA
ncbi:MAG: hypothetical protein AAF764_11800, partial [Pseudomonadota bacterium]